VQPVDKKLLAALVLERLRQSLAALTASHRAAQEAASHPEARQEHSKDMRATEASYVARGLAERVEKLRDEVLTMERMPLRDFAAGERASAGAVITVVHDDERSESYLLAPAGGGEKIEVAGRVILVTTLHSPLGRELAGARTGETITVELPSGRREVEIIGVE